MYFRYYGWPHFHILAGHNAVRTGTYMYARTDWPVATGSTNSTGWDWGIYLKRLTRGQRTGEVWCLRLPWFWSAVGWAATPHSCQFTIVATLWCHRHKLQCRITDWDVCIITYQSLFAHRQSDLWQSKLSQVDTAYLAEPITMTFWIWTRLGPRNRVFRGSQNPLGKENF